MAATAPPEAPKAPAALRAGVCQNRTRNRGWRRSNPRTCNCSAHRHSREVWHMTNVKCQHHKKQNKPSAPNNPTWAPRMRAKRNENRVSEPRRNAGKSSNQRRNCPRKKEPRQPQRCLGQTQAKAHTEEFLSSKSACSWDYARLVSEIEGLMSDDIEANIGSYLNEFIQTMQCIQARAAVTSTPTTLSDAGIADFAKACSKLASSTLDNGRDMSQISLVTLLNQCQQLLSLHSARPSTPKSTSTPRLTSIPTPPRTQKRLVPIPTSTPPIPSPAQEKHIPKIALKLTPTPTPIRSLDSLLPTIEPTAMPMHFNPRYPTAPSRSPSPFPPPTSTSSSPSSPSIFEPPIHEQELSDGEDTANILAEQKVKKWMRRRERERRDLEDTVRFPRFRRERGNVVMRGGEEIGTVGNPIVVDESDESSDSDSDSEEGEEEEAEDSNEEMEDKMESIEENDEVENETQELRCRGSSVDLESVLKHLETSLKWKMQYGIWQNS